MSTELKIGLIGLDTSHVAAFTGLLNNPDCEYRIPGGKVVAAFPGGSPDFPLSIDRVEKITSEVRDGYGIDILDSPRAVARACDAILMTAVDGRAHLKLFEEIAPCGKPVFIDKPFAVSTADAQTIAAIACEHSVPLMSSSSLRYAEPVIEALAAIPKGEILGVDVAGPMDFQASQNDLFWYGIHSAELLFTALGPGCATVNTALSEGHVSLVGVWKDGRIGTLRGDRAAQMAFSLTLHTAAVSHFILAYGNRKPVYAALLEQIMTFFHSGESPICISESLEIIRFLEAANQSRISGAAVRL